MTGFRNTRRYCIVLALASSCLAGFAGYRASAVVLFTTGIVNFDYGLPGYGYPPYGPGAAAIGSAGDIWNAGDLYNPNVVINLSRNDGTPLGLTWNISSGGGQGSASMSGTYGKLLDIETSFYSASIAGLTPGQSYSLYLYAGANWFDHLTVNGVDFYTPGVSPGAINSLTEGTHYVVHTVIADGSGNLVFTPIGAGGPNPAYITAWQLTPVPEPGAVPLAALAAALLALRARTVRRTR